VGFSLGPGETLGLIGATGSGKTTVLHLLMGFLEPSEGRVLLAPGTVFGYVPQRPLLFTGTLRENLLWGDPGAPEARLEEVLEVADALGFVQGFPEGLDTRLGPGGVNLSGGQKQRITLARALVRRPSVLVLDEAFSALDQQTEARVEARLARFLPQTAVVRVAQKIASVRSGPILVLEDGRVAGWGTHDQLMAASPVYRQICLSQGVDR
jgi:ATP-binding cassette subfamily B protein